MPRKYRSRRRYGVGAFGAALGYLGSKVGQWGNQTGYRPRKPRTPKRKRSLSVPATAQRKRQRLFGPGAPTMGAKKLFGRRKRGSVAYGYYTRQRRRYRKVNAPSNYARMGSITRIEDGGTQNDAQCVYVGIVNAPYIQVLKGAIRSLVKELCKQAGQDIKNWEDPPMNLDAYKLSYDVRFVTDATVSQFDVPLTGLANYEAIMEALYSSFFGTFTSGSAPFEFKQFWLNRADPDETIALVRAGDFYLDFACFSSFTVQNRTKAHTGADAADEEADNIENNPLRGRVYQFYSNSLIPKWRENNNATYRGCIGDPQWGYISTTGTQSFPINGTKPPYPNQFQNVFKSSNVILQPGQIKKFTTSWKKSMSWNTFMAKYPYQLDDPSVRTTCYLGSGLVVALERMLDSREVTQPDVKVGYEFDTTVKVKSRYRRGVASDPIIKLLPRIAP